MYSGVYSRQPTTSWYCHVRLPATHPRSWSQVHHQLVLSCSGPSYTSTELVSGTPPASIVMLGSQLHTHGAGLTYTTSWYCHVWVPATHPRSWSHVHHQLVLSCSGPSYIPTKLVSDTPAGIVLYLGPSCTPTELVSGTPPAGIVMFGSQLHTHGAVLRYTSQDWKLRYTS